MKLTRRVISMGDEGDLPSVGATRRRKRKMRTRWRESEDEMKVWKTIKKRSEVKRMKKGKMKVKNQPAGPAITTANHTLGDVLLLLKLNPTASVLLRNTGSVPHLFSLVRGHSNLQSVFGLNF